MTLIDQLPPAVTGGPPYDGHAEEALLGAMLLTVDAIEAGIAAVADTDFYVPNHQVMFRAIVSLYDDGQPVDVVTVPARAAAHEPGGMTTVDAAMCLRLQAGTPVATNAEAYGRRVADLARLRRLAVAADQIRSVAYSHPTEVTEALDQADAIITEATTNRDSESVTIIGDHLAEARERLEAVATPGEISGTSTGFGDVDRILDGLHPGRLLVVGARPAMGKTSFGLNVALHVASQLDQTVLVVSLEMDAVELTQRALSSLAGVNPRSTVGVRADGELKLNQAQQTLSTTPLFYETSPLATVLMVKSKARQLQRRHGNLGLVVVDYLQLMAGVGRAENRQIEVAEMSRQLKALARELDVPVIALSQLSRNLEQRNDKRPMLADLRESGAIEQDADAVMFLYRDEVYNQATETPGVAEVIVAKNRQGPTGVAKLLWQANYQRFANADLRHEPRDDRPRQQTL